MHNPRVLIGKGHQPQIDEEEIGALGTGMVRVKVAYAGICHSDIAAVASKTAPIGDGLGHEVAGTVIESHVDDIAPGDRVIVYGTNDGYFTYLDGTREQIIKLDPQCSLLDAALAEPVACVIGAVEMLDLRTVDDVIVVGAGFMGLVESPRV